MTLDFFRTVLFLSSWTCEAKYFGGHETMTLRTRFSITTRVLLDDSSNANWKATYCSPWQITVVYPALGTKSLLKGHF